MVIDHLLGFIIVSGSFMFFALILVLFLASVYIGFLCLELVKMFHVLCS